VLFLCSLFDDGKARYHKLRESISQFTVTQIGELFTLQAGCCLIVECIINQTNENENYKLTRSIWKMLGPFATTSCLMPIHQMSLAVLSWPACASMSTTTPTTMTTRDSQIREKMPEFFSMVLCTFSVYHEAPMLEFKTRLSIFSYSHDLWLSIKSHFHNRLGLTAELITEWSDLKNSDGTQASDCLGANWHRICLSRLLNHGALWQTVLLRLINILTYLLTY